MSPNWLERATYFRAWDPRLVCVVTLSLVFLCGAAAGAVVMSFGAHTRLHQPAFDTASGKAAYFARIQKELDLTPAQTAQMQSILNDLWQYYQLVINDSRTRVEQVLTEEQRKKFERILQEHQPR
jgi:Spy/CpxP family protein refolding chaperone